jgi:protein-tyrosine-phosphatase
VTRERVLILCTHNSARSQMVLAVFRRVRDAIAARLRGWLAGQRSA